MSIQCVDSISIPISSSVIVCYAVEVIKDMHTADIDQ